MKGTSLETIESQTQQELLYEGLEKFAGAPMSDPVGNMQLEVCRGGFGTGCCPVGALAARWNAGMVVDEVSETDGVLVREQN